MFEIFQALWKRCRISRRAFPRLVALKEEEKKIAGQAYFKVVWAYHLGTGGYKNAL